MVTSLLNRCLGNKIQILDVNSPDFYRVGIVLLSNDNCPFLSVKLCNTTNSNSRS